MTEVRDSDHAHELVLAAGVRETFTEFAAALSEHLNFTSDTLAAFPIPALMSRSMPMHRAARAWHVLDQARAKTGLSPVLIDEDAWEYLLLPATVTPGARGFDAWSAEVRQRRSRLQSLSAAQVLTAHATLQLDDEQPLEQSIRAKLSQLDEVLSGALEMQFAKLDPERVGAWEQGETVPLAELFNQDLDDEDDEDDETDHGSNGVGQRAPLLLKPSAIESPYAAGVDELSVLRAFGNRGNVQLAVLACEPWELPLWLGFGGTNDCPAPEAHRVVWEHWHRNHGARIFMLGMATIDALVSRPPQTLDALAALTAEQLHYAQELGSEGVLPMAWSLYRCGGWGFWWD